MTRNFNGQWIEIFAAGKQTDSEGRSHDITPTYLHQVVSNYSSAIHEAPAVLGHPEDNAPAFGWVAALRVNGDKLEAQFKEVDEEFEAIVRNGKYKKRSASFYTDTATAPGKKVPSLRHVGFLGAMPPAIKGLRDIRFCEGESLTFDTAINFSEGESSMDDKDVQKVADTVFDRIKAAFGFGKKDEPASSFNESGMKAQIEEAVKVATASFTEKLTVLEASNKTLLEKLEQAEALSSRSQIESYVEKLSPAKCPPAFKKMGLVEFMDAIRIADEKVTIISFEEADGKRTEKKEEFTPLAWFKNFLETLPAFIQFGEHFGDLDATGGDAVISPERIQELREKAGMPAKQGGE